MSDGRQYADRDVIAQGDHYIRHISAMTSEDLHGKSDIAAELAHRDIAIAGLRAENAALRGAALQVSRVCEESANLMRDPERTGYWSGADSVARQFDRCCARLRGALSTQEGGVMDSLLTDGRFMCTPDLAVRHARIAHALHIATDPHLSPDSEPMEPFDAIHWFQKAMDEEITVDQFEKILTGESGQ